MILPLLLLAWQLNPQQRFDESLRLFRIQRYAESAAILERMDQEFPGNLDINRLLGQAQASAGYFEKAIAPLELICSQKEAERQSCYLLGRVLTSLKRYDAALAALKRAEINGAGAQIDVAKAEIFEAQGRFPEASAAYRSGLAEATLRHAESARVQVRYGQYLIRRGDVAAALWQFQQAINKQPLWGQAWQEKAMALEKLDRFEDAADAWEQTIAHGERTRENLTRLAALYDRLNQKDKAQALREELKPASQ